MIKAVLFDLDGTLADTAPDLGHALNRQRIMRGLAAAADRALSVPKLRQARAGCLVLGSASNPAISGMMRCGLNFLISMPNTCARNHALFQGVAELLDQLDVRNLPWGIVTNKPARFTIPLMQELGLSNRAACIVSGGDTAHSKPHPEPLFAASNTIAIAPAECIYLGDDYTRRPGQPGCRHGADHRAIWLSWQRVLPNPGEPDTLSTSRRNCSVICNSRFCYSEAVAEEERESKHIATY